MAIFLAGRYIGKNDRIHTYIHSQYLRVIERSEIFDNPQAVFPNSFQLGKKVVHGLLLKTYLRNGRPTNFLHPAS